MTRNRLVLPILIVAILAIAAVITATSTGNSTAPQQAAAGSAISLGHTPAGKAVIDANGRTLYLFAGDRPNLSRLSAAGKAVWPPFTSNRLPAAKGGASAASIATIAATQQITYNGHPLYYYVGDHGRGQASGQGLNQFGARWYVLSASGAAITSASSNGANSQQGTNPSGGTSYGY